MVRSWSSPAAIEAGEGRQRQAVNHHCLDCCAEADVGTAGIYEYTPLMKFSSYEPAIGPLRLPKHGPYQIGLYREGKAVAERAL